MATKTLTADRSSVLADTNAGSYLGGGQDIHLPIVANPAGYDLRAVIGFTIPAGFWSDVKKLTKTELLLTGSAVNHVARGSSPQALVRRLTAAFTQNAAGESWSTSPSVYPGPGFTSTGGVTAALPTGTSQVAIDISTIGLAWAPASVPGGGGAAMYGVILIETGGTANAAELWSAEYATASARPILRITYDTNSAPTAPTLIEPLGPDQQANRVKFRGTDPDGDAITAYDLQYSTDPTFATVTHWNVTNSASGLSAGTVDRSYAGTPLDNTVRYYWRARMKDAGSGTFGPWSSTGTFVKGTGGAATLDQYDAWAAAILADMATGRIALRLGTMRPIDEQVALLTAADFRDLFDLYLDDYTPVVDRQVTILGQRVALSPDGWAVDAVVELVKEG